MSTITIHTTSTSEISAAVAKAKPGDTLIYGKGTYLHPYIPWKEGVRYVGYGIGKTTLEFSSSVPRFGSNLRFGGNEAEGMTISNRGRKTYAFEAGAHATVFDNVRFRAPGAGGLWDMCDFTHHWSDSVRRSKGDFHDVTMRDVELEYPGTNVASLLNMWWDARYGGGAIYNIHFERLHVGVKNHTGQFGQGRGGWLLQPSPPEHASDGPRPPHLPDDSGGIRSTNFGFKWNQVTHGSGKAVGSQEAVKGFGFRLLASNFVGASSFTDFDLCDYLRAWAMCRYKLTEPKLVTQAMRDAAPSQMASAGFDLSGSWFAGKVTMENGRDVKGAYTKNGGSSLYHVPAIVKTHDHELYGV